MCARTALFDGDVNVPGPLQDCLAEAMAHLGDPSIEPFLQRFAQLYTGLDEAGKLAALVSLAVDLEVPFGRDTQAMILPGRPIEANDREGVERLICLRSALESPRVSLLRHFVDIPGGIKFLVDLRADVHARLRDTTTPIALQLLEDDLLHLFRSWFHHGFLQLVPITWQETSAAQLEKLMAHDAVHPIRDWATLRQRLGSDHHCYAFYHPAMPGEPLIFIMLALTHTIADSVDRILQSPSALPAAAPTTAIFYSINAMQPGLAGVSLGNSLIKTVVAELQRRHGELRRFSTLSPMPGFRQQYLEPILHGDDGAARFVLKREDLAAFFNLDDVIAIWQCGGGADFSVSLERILADDRWREDADLKLALKPGLLRLAHHYLVKEHRDRDPLDPVANFHLKNGALLYNINFLSNTSAKGMAESYGMTANYHYDLRQIDENQRQARQGRRCVSPQLEKMLMWGASA